MESVHGQNLRITQVKFKEDNELIIWSNNSRLILNKLLLHNGLSDRVRMKLLLGMFPDKKPHAELLNTSKIHSLVKN